MRYLLLSLIFVASFCRADNFTPIPSKIIGPGGSKISIEGGNATIQPSSGGSVNVVTGAVYVPTVLDFSTSVSPLVSASGHSSLAFDGTNLKLSLNGGGYITLGGTAWGGITGILSSQSDLNTALSGKQSTITFGTGIQTALGVNTGSAGAPVLFNGAGGTPSSLALTNATGLPNASVTGLGALATVTPGTGVATAAAIAINTAGGPLTHGGAGSHTTLAASGAVTFTSTTDSTSSSTGSAIFSGGVAINKKVWIGTASNANSLVVANSGSNGTHSTITDGTNGIRFDGAQDRFALFTSGGGDMIYLRGNGGASPYIQLGGVKVEVSGNVVCVNAGNGLQLKSGTGARAGNATLVGGTVTVTNTTVTANTVVIPSRKTPGGTLGNSLSYSVSAGTSFTITSVDATGVLSALDTSVCSFLLIELN